MKKMLYLMSLAALLFCYSCNTSGSGGKKEKFLSLCEQGVKICEEGIDRMHAAEYPDEFMEICEVYEHRLDKWEEKAENSFSDDEAEELYESDSEVARAFDELKIMRAKFYNIRYEKELEFDVY